MGRGEGPEDDLQSPWSTLLSLVPPLLLPLLLLLPPPLPSLLLPSLALPLSQLARCTPCSIAISGAGAAPMRARPLSRSLAPSFDRRRRRRHSRCCRCWHCRCTYARLPSRSLAGSLVRSPLLALLLLLLLSLVLPLRLRLQLPPRVHPRSLSLVAHRSCASVLCSPCLLSVV